VSEELIIKTNGEDRRVEPGSTIVDLLQSLDIDPRMVAVELNRVIVRKTEFENTKLSDGDEVELVHFVGGG